MKYSVFDVNKISNTHIRNYFSEVLSCYENENYRAAISTLYTVILYDFVFKLQELEDEYEDSDARKLLASLKEDGDKRKDTWENLLIDGLHKSKNFEIVDDNLYSTIKAIKDKRNLSAHPSFQHGQEIYQPTRELTLAFIKEIFENLLIHPSQFMTNKLDRIWNFFEGRVAEFGTSNFYLDTSESNYFFSHFNSRYYSRMGTVQKTIFFRNLWVITFEKNTPELEDNFLNLFVIIKLFNVDRHLYNDFVQDKIKSDKMKDVIDLKIKLNRFILFLNVFPELFSNLDQDVQAKIKTKFRNKDYCLCLWYTEDSLSEYLNELIEDDNMDDLYKITSNQLRFFHFICKERGEIESFNKFSLSVLEKYVPDWLGYDRANDIMATFVLPYIGGFKESDFLRYADIRNLNNQISGRDRDLQDNKVMIETMKKVGIETQQFEQRLES
ncbi:hypothetical protein [Streptococcus hyointestinalis]|uniref:hypothetical protein n=1 Tax=Streptococcus hyointestinalis TaxID=1337 RepID=UPI003D03AFEF